MPSPEITPGIVHVLVHVLLRWGRRSEEDIQRFQQIFEWLHDSKRKYEYLCFFFYTLGSRSTLHTCTINLYSSSTPSEIEIQTGEQSHPRSQN